MFGENANNQTKFTFGTSGAPIATSQPANNLFGNSTTATPAFGAPSSSVATNTVNATTNTLFGSTSAAPTFGSASSTAPTFGSASSAAPTFGSTSTAPTFGSASSAAPTFGSTPASSTAFGSSTGSIFGSSNTDATKTNPTFGTATSTPAVTNTLFGSSNTLFGAQNNTNTTAAPQQQQPQHFLDVRHCFPDSNLSSYIVKPDGITRSTDLVNQLFGGTYSRAYAEQQKAFKSNSPQSLCLDGKPTVLPLFLTATDSNLISNSNNKSSANSAVGKKRLLEENTITGREKSQKGVFGQSDTLTEGFKKNLKKLDNANHLPKESLNDIGMNPTSFKENCPLPNQKTTHQESQKSLKTKVRVFGYDHNRTKEIISFFTKLGALVEPYTSQGNWITFSYVSPDAAAKAISYNGMTIDNDHMVGVTWDEMAKEITLLQPNNCDLFKDTALFMNSMQPQSQQLQQSQTQTQQKEDGILNRLREKLLGW